MGHHLLKKEHKKSPEQPVIVTFPSIQDTKKSILSEMSSSLKAQVAKSALAFDGDFRKGVQNANTALVAKQQCIEKFMALRGSPNEKKLELTIRSFTGLLKSTRFNRALCNKCLRKVGLQMIKSVANERKYIVRRLAAK